MATLLTWGEKVRLYCSAYNPNNGNPLAFDAPGPTITISDPTVMSAVSNGDNSFTVTAIGLGTTNISITGKATIGGTQFTRTWGPVLVGVLDSPDRPIDVNMVVTVTSLQV